MAYVRLGNAKNYIGFSTDQKPYRGRQADGTNVTASDLPQGSTFAEIDTGHVAVFMGAIANSKGEWVYLPKPPQSDLVAKFDELKTLLTEMRDMQAKMLLAMVGS